MHCIRGLHNVRSKHQGCAVTVGNFDGCHLGHQALLDELKEKAHQYGIPVLVVIFEPHPREHFIPETAPPRLTNLREKVGRLATYGVDYVLILRFNRAFSKQSAEQFVEEVLVKTLHTRFLLVGSNFRFGYQRQGDYALLQQVSKHYGFEVAEAKICYLAGERISSTRVRRVLSEGECESAKALLGGWYPICGKVVKGSQLGLRLGFPTVNIPLKRLHAPLHGVFVVRVYGVNPLSPEYAVDGVANVGTNPTVGGKTWLLEVFLLPVENGPSFEGLCGRLLQVEFIYYIRAEVRLDSLEALKQKIAQDVSAAKQFLRSNRGL